MYGGGTQRGTRYHTQYRVFIAQRYCYTERSPRCSSRHSRALLLIWVILWGQCPHAFKGLGASAPTAPMLLPPMPVSVLAVVGGGGGGGGGLFHCLCMHVPLVKMRLVVFMALKCVKPFFEFCTCAFRNINMFFIWKFNWLMLNGV